MRVHQVPVGGMQNFCYVIWDETTRKGIVIDPSWDLNRITDIISEHGIDILYIVNTHHHFDHTTGNSEMARLTGAKIIQHKSSNLERDIGVSDGDTIEFGSCSLRVVHTPGHSQDSICLVGDGRIFTGDTLFIGSCGRTDLPGGDAGELYDSLQLLRTLDDSLLVYSGHDYGSSLHTTLGVQKETNPVMQQRSRSDFIAMLGG